MPQFFSISNPQFQYAMRLITNITNATQAAITTSINHGYTSGLRVRINLPRQWGMTQIDKKDGIITVTGNNTFTIDIDTSNYDNFTTPVNTNLWYIKNPPQAIPMTGLTENIEGLNNSIT